MAQSQELLCLLLQVLDLLVVLVSESEHLPLFVDVDLLLIKVLSKFVPHGAAATLAVLLVSLLRALLLLIVL